MSLLKQCMLNNELPFLILILYGNTLQIQRGATLFTIKEDLTNKIQNVSYFLSTIWQDLVYFDGQHLTKEYIPPFYMRDTCLFRVALHDEEVWLGKVNLK